MDYDEMVLVLDVRAEMNGFHSPRPMDDMDRELIAELKESQPVPHEPATPAPIAAQ